MAAKIDRACLEADPSRTVWASEYDKHVHGTPLCPDRRCRCVLQGVRGTTRNVNDTQVSVAAYFRLPTGAEEAGLGHKPSCRFNVRRTVDKLVARSREMRNPDTEPLLTSERQGAELRLHILMELWRFPRGDAPALEDGFGSAGTATGHTYVSSGRDLQPYLRIARAVLALMARIQEREELARVIRLKYGRHTLTWEDYFFDFPDYEKLRDYLAAHGQFQRRPGENRPVAAVVEIKRERLRRQTRYGSWPIRCEPVPCADENGDVFELLPTLYTKNGSLAEKLVKERYLLVCAIPRISELKPPLREGGPPFVDLQMTIVDRSQVCRWFPTWSQL